MDNHTGVGGLISNYICLTVYQIFCILPQPQGCWSHSQPDTSSMFVDAWYLQVSPICSNISKALYDFINAYFLIFFSNLTQMAVPYVEKASNCPTYMMRYAEVLAVSFTSGVIMAHWRQLRQTNHTRSTRPIYDMNTKLAGCKYFK